MEPDRKKIDICTGRYLREALRYAAVSLESRVAEINALNVFPVPDGDTGTNMYMTLQAAVSEMDKLTEPTLGAVIHAAAHGALMGARGNSGVILSQLLRGLARSLDHKRAASPHDLALAFAEASATARRGVAKPVEGTMLTVASDAVEAASAAAAGGGDVREVIWAAIEAARASVARTPSLLPVLQQAGVVDAGGQGLLVILEGAWRCFLGEQPVSQVAAPARAPSHLAPVVEPVYGYCTEFLLRGSHLDQEQIRAQMVSLGDSLLVVGEPDLVRVHIHTLKPGQVIDYATGLGTLHQIKIDNMQEQHRQFLVERPVFDGTAAGGVGLMTKDLARPERPALPGPYLPSLPSIRADSLTGISIIAVSPGPGFDRVLASLGAKAVAGGQTMNPSIRELLDAVERADTDQVILLPNNANIVLTAQQVRALAEKEVVVVPTETVPQGIASLMAFSFEADLAANAALMVKAARSVDTLEVTRAVRSSHLDGLPVHKGELIGLLNGRLVVTGKAHEPLIKELIGKARSNGRAWELATIYYGKDVKPSQAGALAERLRLHYRGQQFELVKGEQPFYDYIISIE